MEKDTTTLKNNAGNEKDTCENNQDILSLKRPEVVNENIKLQCDMCESSLKKKVTLEKHKNTKHMQINNLFVKKLEKVIWVCFRCTTRQGNRCRGIKIIMVRKKEHI